MRPSIYWSLVVRLEVRTAAAAKKRITTALRPWPGRQTTAVPVESKDMIIGRHDEWWKNGEGGFGSSSPLSLVRINNHSRIRLVAALRSSSLSYSYRPVSLAHQILP